MKRKKPYINSSSKEIPLAQGIKKTKASLGQKEVSGLLSEYQILSSQLQQMQEKLQAFGVRLQDAGMAAGTAPIEAPEVPEKELLIPLSIFRSRLSTLELVAAYLRDRESLTIAEIAFLLERDHRTIWHAYSRFKKKGIRLSVKDSEINIPISVFADRHLSPLEAFVVYLRDSHNLTFNEIAALKERSAKTIWTVYSRAKKKNLKNAKN